MAEWRQFANKQRQKRDAKGKRPARQSAEAKDRIIVQRMRMSGLEFGTSSYKKAHVRQLRCRGKPYLYRFGQQSTSAQDDSMLSKVISASSNGTNCLGPILVYFCWFQVTSDLILCTIISPFASADSRAGRFPSAALF